MKLKPYDYVHPTRRCFDDAAEIMGLFIKHHPELRDSLRVVHALIHGNEPGHEGEIIAHGWVELDDEIIFRGIVNDETMEFSTPRRQFYRKTQPILLIRYTAYEVLDNMERCDHTGPWLAEFQEHTRQGKEERISKNITRNVLTSC